MVMRQLTEDEKRMWTKNMDRTLEECELLSVDIEQIEMALKHAPMRYKQQVKQLEFKLKQLKESQTLNLNVIAEGNKQLKDGVEIQEVKRPIGVD